MRHSSLLIAASAVLQAAALPAQSAAPFPAPARPTGQWVMKGENRMCVLSRDYSVAGRPLTLGIRTSPLGQDATVIVVDAPRRQDYADGNVAIDTGAGPGKRSWSYSFEPRSAAMRITSVYTDRATLAAAAASGRLGLRGGRLINVNFAVPAMTGALSVLRQCNEALAAQLGMPIAEQRRLATPAVPRTPLLNLFNSNDYPYEALMHDRGGQPLAMLTIDPSGAVAGCETIEKSGTDSLDARTCQVAGHAKFLPARDRAGQPMRSLYFFRVKWYVGG